MKKEGEVRRKEWRMRNEIGRGRKADREKGKERGKDEKKGG